MINENNKFFTYVWRFNALAIAGIAILSGLIGAYALISILKNETSERHVANIVNVGKQEKVKNDFVLGYPYALAGTDYIIVPLYRNQTYDLSYSSKSTGDNQVNYLFFNGRTGKNKWLAENTNQLFISNIVLSEKLKNSNENNDKATAIIYEVVEKDTNGDERLSEKDGLALFSSNIDGSGYKKLIDNIDKLYSFKQISDDRLLVFYKRNKETKAGVYEIPSMKKILENKIPSSK